MRTRHHHRRTPSPPPRRHTTAAPRPAAGRRARPPHRRGRARPSLLGRIGRVAACAASACLLALSGFAWYAYHSLTSGLTTSNALDAIRRTVPGHLDNSVNLLLIGLDSRKDQNGDDLPKRFVQGELHAGSSSIGYYNTNTLILMHIPAGGGRVTAFSIPRDDYVETYNGDGSPQGMHKIKEAYAVAYTIAHDRLSAQGVAGAALEHRAREYGREATLATVQNLLGVPIDHFSEVNLLGFYDIAQVLQPIQVCLKRPVRDWYSGADFPAGLQNLDARQALAFVRQRHGLPNGDLDRTHRQQAFLSSVMHKLRSAGILGDLGRMQDLFNVVKKDVVIDNSWNILDFAQQATNLTGGNVTFNTLPITGFATENGEDVNTVDPRYLRQVVQASFGEGDAQSASGKDPGSGAGAGQKAAPATVDVLNGSGVTGAAARELRQLAASGYAAGAAANAPRRQTVSTVVYGTGAREAARQIAARLGTAPPWLSSTLAPGRAPDPRGAAAAAAGASGGCGASGKAPAAASAPTSSPAPAPTFAGDEVRMGGIPCVD